MVREKGITYTKQDPNDTRPNAAVTQEKIEKLKHEAKVYNGEVKEDSVAERFRQRKPPIDTFLIPSSILQYKFGYFHNGE